MMIGLVFAMLASGVGHAAKYPADVAPLIAKANRLSGSFVNAPETRSTLKARRDYEAVDRQLKAKGWCWGSRDRNAAEADMVWLPCRSDRSGT